MCTLVICVCAENPDAATWDLDGDISADMVFECRYMLGTMFMVSVYGVLMISLHVGAIPEFVFYASLGTSTAILLGVLLMGYLLKIIP